MPKQYFSNQDGQVAGPYTGAELKEQAAEGKLQRHALISEDQQNWVSAANVKGLTFRQLDEASSLLDTAVATAPNPAPENGARSGLASPDQAQLPVVDGRRPDSPPIKKGAAIVNKLQEIRQGRGIDTARRIGKKIKQGGERALTAGDGYQLPQAAINNPVKFDIFLSYRRHGGGEIARLLAEKLERVGYAVFLDVDGLAEGDWSAELERQIDQCEDFIPIITPDFFSRCENPDDVVRKEISRALSKDKNIVPFFATEQPFPETLPDELASLPKMNGLNYSHEYADQVVAKLCTMLRSGRTGPARLETGELQPRIVVACMAVAVGCCFGSFAVPYTNPFTSVFVVLSTAARSALSSIVLFAIPLLLVQSLVSAFKGVRPDRLYSGRAWAIFWAMFCPLVALPTSLAVPFVTWIVGQWTYKFLPNSSYSMPSTTTHVIASAVGAIIAFVIMRIVIMTKAWTVVTRTVGLSKWV